MAEPRVASTAIEIIGATPSALRALLSGVPNDALEAPVDEGWSAKDVVAHLLDAHSVAFTDRIRRILSEDRPLIKPIDPSARLQEQGYGSWTLGRLLDTFERVRNDDLTMLRGLSAEQMGRLADHAEAGEISVSDLAHQCAVHDMMHLQQIARMLQTQLARHVGNMARYIDQP